MKDMKDHADRAEKVAAEMADLAKALIAGKFDDVTEMGRRVIDALDDLSTHAVEADMPRVVEHAEADNSTVDELIDLAKESAEKLEAERKALKPEELAQFEEVLQFAIVAGLSVPASSLVAMGAAWMSWARAVDP